MVCREAMAEYSFFLPMLPNLDGSRSGIFHHPTQSCLFMDFTALSCPQCGGTLPRQARWRMVACPYCTAMVTRNSELVEAAQFHQAWLRAQAALPRATRRLEFADRCYHVLAQLASGENCEIYLAEHRHIFAERVVIKHARSPAAADRLQAEQETLLALQRSDRPGSAYFSQRLPQTIHRGTASLDGDTPRMALVLRQSPGFWGNMATALHYHGAGIDPRHAVWIWRRVLDVLGFVHAAGWTHGDLRAEHWLVQPRDHGILLVGWGEARADASPHTIGRDLCQSAWTLRRLLCGDHPDKAPGFGTSTPDPLVRLLRLASEDSDWCATQGAEGIDAQLRLAARESFGAPRFLDFSPTHRAT